MNKSLVVVLVVLTIVGAIVFLQRKEVPQVAPDAPITREPDVTIAAPEAIVPNPSPVDFDDRPMIVILRERARWPMEVALTKDYVLKVDGGEITLHAGRKVRALMLNDAGLLLATLADEHRFQVPFDETDFVDLVLLRSSEASPPAAKPMTTPPPAPRPKAPRVDLDSALAKLKARFPAPRKERVSVGITNASGTRRSDIVEVEIPHPDVHQRYRGWVMSASVASLPAIVARLEAQLDADLASNLGSSLSGSANAQSFYSRQWLNSTMRPYLRELRALIR